MTRIKFCGLTSVDDVEAAVRLSVDALGFVFVQQSPRCISAETARQLCGRAPALTARVGLFMNQDAKAVIEIIEQVPINVLQFHGQENNAFCAQFGLPFIKAVAMKDNNPGSPESLDFPDAAALLLDSHSVDTPGGSGALFDWRKVPSELKQPMIVAGGLTPANVGAAVRQLTPYGVDVSTGIESKPGVKDHQLMAAFCAAVRTSHD